MRKITALRALCETLTGETSNGNTIGEVLQDINDKYPTPAPVVTKYTVTYDVNGGTGTVEAVEVTAGESITLDDGSGITAPEGKEFVGWATTDDAESADVTSPYTPEADVTLYAVYGDE
jgi:hypothetical protein